MDQGQDRESWERKKQQLKKEKATSTLMLQESACYVCAEMYCDNVKTVAKISEQFHCSKRSRQKRQMGAIDLACKIC